jgi:hypothetical protein
MRFSCITFGSPPFIRPKLEPSNLTEGSLILNIINEYDLVTRADRPYIRSLIDLYRSIYDLPPIDERVPKDIGTPQIPSTNPHGESFSDRNEATAKYWALPEPTYWHFGELVVLKLGISTEEPENQLALSAWNISPENFEKLLFCRVAVHRRVVYQERVQLLAAGRFNGRRGFGDSSSSDVGSLIGEPGVDRVR